MLWESQEPVSEAQGRFIPTDEVTNVFVMEKQEGFGQEYPPEKRNGEWEYAWFQPDGSRKADAEFDGCFSCHLNRAERDFTFTFYKYVLDQKGGRVLISHPEGGSLRLPAVSLQRRRRSS